MIAAYAALTHKSFITFRKRRDEFMRVRLPGRFDNFSLRRSRASISDVFPDGASEQDSLLQHEAYLRPQRIQLECCYVGAIDQDAPAAGIVKARNKTKHG